MQEEPEGLVTFGAVLTRSTIIDAGSTISSLYETPEADPFDFTVYMDQAPMTVQAHAPLEVVQQLFVKLGARYIVVVNADGLCEYFFPLVFTSS